MFYIKRLGKLLILIIVLPLLALGGWMGVQQLTGNFHEVIASEFYRSAQPKPGKITEWHKSFGLGSIINLRDDISPQELAEEQQEAQANGVVFYHFPLSSTKRVSIPKARELAKIMKDLPKPLLVHCDHGANRTGFASAVYLGKIAGKSEISAELQMSPYYGHIPLRGIGRYAMYESWDIYEETLGF